MIKRSKDGLRRVKVCGHVVYFESRKQAQSGYRYHPAYRHQYATEAMALAFAFRYLELGRIVIPKPHGLVTEARESFLRRVWGWLFGKRGA